MLLQYDPFFGGMEMLFYTEDYMSREAVDTLDSDLNVITFKQEIDDEGLIKEKAITEKGVNIFKVDYFKEKMIDTESGDETQRLTGRINKELHTYKNSSTYYKYNTDDFGNLTNISKDNVIKSRYTYDYLQRLVNEDDVSLRVITNYTYDLNGNITKKAKTPYGSQTPSEMNFSYENSCFKDLLTKVTYPDGRVINFDYDLTSLGRISRCIKNNITYNFNWKGSKLSSISEGNIELLKYQYDANGNRISKEYDGELTKYYYDINSNLVREEGEDIVDYLYDNTNKLYAMILNGIKEYIIRNRWNKSKGKLRHRYSRN